MFTFITDLKKKFASDPTKKLATIMSELQDLKRDLNFVNGQPDALRAIVEFFRLTSPWHDRGLQDILEAFAAANYKHRYDATIANLNFLEAHFRNAGRDRYGWNRTEKGDRISAYEIYLGNIYGLFTLTVADWMAKKDEPKGGWGFPNMEHLNAYDVVSQQARDFMKSHVPPMTALIDALATVAKVERAA